MNFFSDINLFRFFDHFGLVVFAFLLVDAVVDIRNAATPTWRMYVRAFTGVAGLLIDGFLVFFY